MKWNWKTVRLFLIIIVPVMALVLGGVLLWKVAGLVWVGQILWAVGVFILLTMSLWAGKVIEWYYTKYGWD